MHLLEAMGCGVPLISTSFSAVGEMFDAAVGYEVGYKMIVAKNKIYSGQWGDPDNDELIARMREVYSDRDTADRLGLWPGSSAGVQLGREHPQAHRGTGEARLPADGHAREENRAAA